MISHIQGRQKLPAHEKKGCEILLDIWRLRPERECIKTEETSNRMVKLSTTSYNHSLFSKGLPRQVFKLWDIKMEKWKSIFRMIEHP